MSQALSVSFPAASEEHALRPDALAVAALRSLTREHPLPPRWGAAQTVVLGAVSFGILPLYAWPRTFRTSATIERQQLMHLAEWLRLRSGHSDAVALPELAARTGFRSVMWASSVLCVIAVVAIFWLNAFPSGFDLPDLYAATYGIGATPTHLSFGEAKKLFVAWSVWLSIAYLLHWLHLHLHHADIRRFVEAFNRLSAREGVRPVVVHPLGLGVRPFWVLGAVVLASFGAVWAIPMCLAGAIQARWRKDSRIVRAGLSDALQHLLLLRRPELRVTRPAQLGDFCHNDLCRNRVPPQAEYCPRCGQHVSSPAAVAGEAKVA